MTAPADREHASTTSELPWRRFARQVVMVLGVGMLLYVGLAVWSGLHTVGSTLADFPMKSRGSAVVGLVLLGWALRGLRWHDYTRRLGLQIPVGASLLVFASSFAFTATPGKAGEVVKSFLLKLRYDVSITATASILLVERLTDLLAVLVLSAGGLTLIDARVYFLAGLLLLAALSLFVMSRRVHSPLLRGLGAIPALAVLARVLEGLLASGQRLLRPAPLLLGLGLGLLAWGCEALALHLILGGLGHAQPLIASAAIFGLATLIGALSMLPGGIGGFEATMLVLLAGAGVPRGAAVAATLLIRFGTLWLVSLLGGLCLILWWLRGRESPELPPAGS